MRAANNIVSESGFERVENKNTAKMKRNSLYNLLRSETPEIRNIVSGYDVEPIKTLQSRNAILISFVEKFQSVNVFDNPDYTRSDQHLRIDDIYCASANTLTAFHYTETYNSKSGGGRIVVHAYFNSYGGYVCLVVKETKSNNTEVILNVSPETKQRILSNVKPASELLQKLLHYKNELYIKELNTSYKLGEELSKLSKNIHTEEGWDSYIIAANDFIACVNRINVLNEIHIDMRGKNLLNMITCFINRGQESENLSTTDNEFIDESDGEVKPIKRTNYHKKSQKQFHNRPQHTFQEGQFGVLLDEINKSVEQTNSFITVQDPVIACQTLDKILFNMQIYLLRMYDYKSMVSNHEKFNNTVSDLERVIKSGEDRIVACMQEAIETRNLAVVEQIFHFSKNHIKSTVYINYLEKLIFGDTGDEDLDQTAIIAVCDYLYQQSDVFKNSVLFVSKEFGRCGDFSFNLLLMLCCDDKFLLFKKFIEYGANCEIGMFHHKNNTMLPLLNCILDHITSPDGEKYIELLLLQNIKCMSAKEFNKNGSVILMFLWREAEHTSNVSNVKFDVMTQEAFKSIYNLSPLEIVVRHKMNINQNIVQQLTTWANLKSLALSLVYLSNLKCISTATVPSKLQNGILFCDSYHDKIEKLTAAAAREQANKLLYVMHINTDDAPETFKEAIQLICAQFNKKYLDVQDCEIDNAIDQILSGDNTQQGAPDKLTAYTGCLFLLSIKPNLSSKDSLQVCAFFKELIVLDPNNIAVVSRLDVFIASSAYKNTIATNECINLINASKKKILINACLATATRDGKAGNSDKLLTHIHELTYFTGDFVSCINSVISNNKQILHYACGSGSYECAKLLILFGASIYSKTSEGSILDVSNFSSPQKNALEELYNYMFKESEICLDTTYNVLITKDPAKINKFFPFIQTIENKYFFGSNSIIPRKNKIT